LQENLSGPKNLLVKKLIFSTDDYWHEVEDKKNPKIYSFNPNKLKQAHRWNFERFKKAVDLAKPLVIVDNTNVTSKEFCCTYLRYALQNNYSASIEEPTNTHWLKIRDVLVEKDSETIKEWAFYLAQGSQATHNVPQHVIEKMMWKWETNLDLDSVISNCNQKHAPTQVF
jgi:hypothetical protein